MSGQSLLELALALPILLLLSVGTVAVVRVADARSGLDAATSAAAAVAARQPDPASASAAAGRTFATLATAYPLRSPRLTLRLGSFSRGSSLEAAGVAAVDLSWAPFPGLPGELPLEAKASALIEPWRSR
jgi:hypothetical protein